MFVLDISLWNGYKIFVYGDKISKKCKSILIHFMRKKKKGKEKEKIKKILKDLYIYNDNTILVK